MWSLKKMFGCDKDIPERRKNFEQRRKFDEEVLELSFKDALQATARFRSIDLNPLETITKKIGEDKDD